MTKKQLKAIVKECLAEILVEGMSEQLAESIKARVSARGPVSRKQTVLPELAQPSRRLDPRAVVPAFPSSDSLGSESAELSGNEPLSALDRVGLMDTGAWEKLAFADKNGNGS